MKKFKFRLEPVFRYRQILKDMQEAKLAAANGAYNETQAFLDDLADQKQGVYEGMIASAEQGFSLLDYQSMSAFNDKIDKTSHKEKVRLAKRKKAVDFEKKKYISLAQGVEAVKKLKSKAKDLHQIELLDEENKLIDDLVNSRFRVDPI